MKKTHRRGSSPKDRRSSKKRSGRAGKAAPPARKTIRAKNPGDLLALVPRVLGFHPEESVVLVTLGETACPYVRVDIPSDPEDRALVLHDLMVVVDRFHPERLAVVVYSGDPLMTELVTVPLLRGLADRGVHVPVTVRADGERWFCLGPDGDGFCDQGCPADGTRYDARTHPIVLDAVVDGEVVLESREALRDSLLPDDPDEVAAVAAAMDEAADRMLGTLRTPQDPDPAGYRQHLVREGRWLQHRVRRFLADRQRLDAHDVGRLLVAMVSVEVRDVAWAEMTRRNAAAHVDLWRDVVRRGPLDSIAAPAALLAFAAWLAGNGALAWCAVERCQEAEPDYSMAGLVSQALAGAVPPSSWQPLGPGALTLFAS